MNASNYLKYGTFFGFGALLGLGDSFMIYSSMPILVAETMFLAAGGKVVQKIDLMGYAEGEITDPLKDYPYWLSAGFLAGGTAGKLVRDYNGL